MSLEGILHARRVIRAGFKNEQKAIYDVVKDSYIYMKDEVDERTNKARSGGSSEASQGNDPTGSGSLRGRNGGSPTGQRVNRPCLPWQIHSTKTPTR
jgi:hypothetical protein